jgi:hypothetical protein
MIFRRSICCITIALVAAACSPKPDGAAAHLTGPSAMTLPDPSGSGGISRPALVNFPARTDTLDFRHQLESKYVSMGRPAQQVFVDQDGEVAWIGEYERYRVNGCDHDTATRNVMAQIDGQAAAPVCALLAFPETAVYPPRDHVVDFRRQLGAKYQSMGRAAQSSVDADGAAIWISEYLRYRTSGCDHATAVQKTLTQVDGNAAPGTCVEACAYYIAGPQLAPATGGSLSAEMVRTSGSCEWIAESEVEWIVLNRPITGGDRSVLTYTILPNSGGSRSGSIRVNYPGGRSYVQVNQGAQSTNVGFQLFDLSTQSTATTECRLKVTNTACTLSAVNTALPNPIATYDWRVEYAYNGSKVKTQASALSTFTFNETCGPSAADGSPIAMSVRLTVTDTAGNTQTVSSGQGIQPMLQLRSYNCS